MYNIYINDTNHLTPCCACARARGNEHIHITSGQ